MKIAYVSTTPGTTLNDVGGAPTHMRKTLENFAAFGHAVCPFLADDLVKPESVVLHRQEKPGYFLAVKKLIPRYVWQTAKEIAYVRYNRKMFTEVLPKIYNFSPDLIYERMEFRADTGYRVAKKLAIPRILEVNGCFTFDWQPTPSLLSAYCARAEIQNAEAADYIITVSGAIKDYLLKKTRIPPERIAVIPNGADTKMFDPARHDGASIRAKLGITAKTVVGFVGYFAPYHGISKLIDAAHLLNDPSIAFLLVGDGIEAPLLKEKIAKLHLENSVFITGFVDLGKVPDYLAAMDIAVMPDSNWFGSPIKIFEYGAMEKPIIAPKVPPVLEVMNDGKDGILIAPGSAKELADGIKTFIQNPDLAKRCAKNFRKKVLASFRWDLNIKKILDIGESLLNKRPGKPITR